MLPFLLIQTRVDDDIAADELRSTRQLGGFEAHELSSLRLEAEESCPDWETILSTHSGIILGGSPFNATDSVKSELQERVESHLTQLLDRVVERGFPFLGACYGISTLGLHRGGLVDRTYGEAAAAIDVTLTDAGAVDPLCRGLSPVFTAFVGHKEAMSRVPPGAVVLATGTACPVQMFRIGTNLYATQFHPELDFEGLAFRLSRYRSEGYVPEGELATALAAAAERPVSEPGIILANFKRVYSASTAGGA